MTTSQRGSARDESRREHGQNLGAILGGSPGRSGELDHFAQRRLERPVSNRPTLRNILPTMRNGAAIALMAAGYYSASRF
jgi:hypothetical protein